MTAAVPDLVVDPPSWRAGRLAARAAVLACAAFFLLGVGLWARDGELIAARAALPSGWSEAELRAAAGAADVPLGLLSAYVMTLEVLAAGAGLVAAALLLRGGHSWFRLYVAVALALWTTFGGVMSLVYADALSGAAGEVASAVRGLAWMAMLPAAYLFPDGRFVPRWTRWAALAWPAYFVLLVGLYLLGRDSDPESLVETLPLLVLFGSVLYAVVHRYRRVSTPEQRRQTRGVVAALALWFVVALVSVATPLRSLREQVSAAGLVANGLLQLFGYLAVVSLATAVTVAILRYRLYDVDVWVNRALVYLGLTTIVVLAYAGLAALGGLVWSSRDLAGPLVATIVIAALLHPLRLRVQRWVDRFVYGRRRERYEVLVELGRTLESLVPPDQVLRALVRDVGTTLKLPYVAATHGQVRVTHPEDAVRPAGGEHVFPIRWQGEDLGTLTVVTRPGDDLVPADRDLLDGLARQAGAAVRAAALFDDLRRSRERILVAGEEERRRLQRDLHDGLGPTLASLYQRVDAAGSLLRRDPDAAERLLAEAGAQMRVVSADVRALVRDLRPPELDDLGLAAALSAGAARFEGLSVAVEATDLPALPAAVEVAAYRIVMEALTNAARHAGARHVVVGMGVEADRLQLTVVDDGRGLTDPSSDGTGLRSMRERADILGGTCRVELGPTRGTRVRAELPLEVES